jgi:DNA-binding NtrC family response regulator
MTDKRILLVDDEEIILDTYSSLLSEKGYYVATACSGSEALAKCFKQPFDLIITDLAMMNGDGLTVLEEIKAKSPHTQVIILTGTRSKVVSEFVSRLGAYALIEKPCSNEFFLSCIKDALMKARTLL